MSLFEAISTAVQSHTVAHKLYKSNNHSVLVVFGSPKKLSKKAMIKITDEAIRSLTSFRLTLK